MVRRAKTHLEMEGYRPSVTKSCPQVFADVLHDCLAPDPEKRPSARDVVQRINTCLDGFPPDPRFD